MFAELALGAGVVGGLFQGIAGIFGANQRNQQAQQAWIQGEFQKAINNGKALFNASYAEMQQNERNAAIQRAAYLYESDSLRVLDQQKSFTQGELSKTYRQMKGALANKLVSSRISGGTSKALSLSQSSNFLRQAMQADQNFKQTEANINRQMQNMMAQQRFDLIIPNMQLPSAKPISESTGILGVLAGGLGGLASGLGSYAQLHGAGLSTWSNSPGGGTSNDFFPMGDRGGPIE